MTREDQPKFIEIVDSTQIAAFEGQRAGAKFRGYGMKAIPGSNTKIEIKDPNTRVRIRVTNEGTFVQLKYVGPDPIPHQVLSPTPKMDEETFVPPYPGSFIHLSSIPDHEVPPPPSFPPSDDRGGNCGAESVDIHTDGQDTSSSTVIEEKATVAMDSSSGAPALSRPAPVNPPLEPAVYRNQPSHPQRGLLGEIVDKPLSPPLVARQISPVPHITPTLEIPRSGGRIPMQDYIPRCSSFSTTAPVRGSERHIPCQNTPGVSRKSDHGLFGKLTLLVSRKGLKRGREENEEHVERPPEHHKRRLLSWGRRTKV